MPPTRTRARCGTLRVRLRKRRHKDFYLPSRRELDALVETIRDTFDETAWYWSSTEQSRLLAWGRNFGGAHIDSNFKNMPARALAVRTVPVIESVKTAGAG